MVGHRVYRYIGGQALGNHDLTGCMAGQVGFVDNVSQPCYRCDHETAMGCLLWAAARDDEGCLFPCFITHGLRRGVRLFQISFVRGFEAFCLSLHGRLKLAGK